MKTVTVEQFKGFRPCWLESAAGRARFRAIAAIRDEWTAVDILDLPGVSAEDKLWSVLRPELIDEATMHEFACRCAEQALARAKNPDPRSVAAIAAKRAWLRGEIGDAELAAARDAARGAARAAACDAALAAALAAAEAAAEADACDAALAAAWGDVCDAAWGAARDAAWTAQISMLREMCVENGET